MKKKLLLTLAIVAILTCLFAISVSAATYDTTRKVILDDTTELSLYDADGNALSYYMSNGALTTVKTADILSTGTTTISGVTYTTFTFNGVNANDMVVVNFQDEKLGDLQAFATKFQGSTVLEYCYMPKTLERLSINYDAANVFRETTKCKIVDFPVDCELNFIGKYSFSKATALKEIYIPANLTTFPEGASATGWDWGCFTDCTSLEKVTFAENSQLKTITNAVFFGCTSLKEITIPDGVEYVGTYAFKNTAIVDSPFTENSNCTYLGRWVFYGCTQLTNINIPKNATFSTTDSALNQGFFHNCTSLTTVNFHPDSIDTLYPAYMFTGCSALKTIQLPNSLTQLPCRMFNGCSSLETIVLGANVVGMNNLRQHSSDHNSFTYGCNSLKYVYLPKTLNIDAENHSNACHMFGSGGNITFYYDGTYAQAVALQNQFKNNVTYCGNNGKITGAEIISLADYNKLTEIKKCYLVYGGNTCDMFYGGAHGVSETTYDFEGEDYTTDFYQYAGCSRCNNRVETFICGPLVINKGYAKEENGSLFTYGVVFTKENIAKFVATKQEGYVFNYGLVVASNEASTDGTLFDSNGVSINGAISLDATGVEYTIYNLKLTEIKDTQKDMAVYACAYVIDNGTASYIGETVTEKAVTITYNSIKAIIPEETKVQ